MCPADGARTEHGTGFDVLVSCLYVLLLLLLLQKRCCNAYSSLFIVLIYTERPFFEDVYLSYVV